MLRKSKVLGGNGLDLPRLYGKITARNNRGFIAQEKPKNNGFDLEGGNVEPEVFRRARTGFEKQNSGSGYGGAYRQPPKTAWGQPPKGAAPQVVADSVLTAWVQREAGQAKRNAPKPQINSARRHHEPKPQRTPRSSVSARVPKGREKKKNRRSYAAVVGARDTDSESTTSSVRNQVRELMSNHLGGFETASTTETDSSYGSDISRWSSGGSSIDSKAGEVDRNRRLLQTLTKEINSIGGGHRVDLQRYGVLVDQIQRFHGQLEGAISLTTKERKEHAAQREEWQEKCRLAEFASIEHNEKIVFRLKNLREALTGVMREKDEAIGQREQLKTELSNNRLKEQALENRLTREGASNKELQQKLETSRKRSAELGQAIEQATQSHKQTIGKLEGEISGLRKDLADKNVNLSAAQSQVESLGGQIEGLQKSLKSQKAQHQKDLKEQEARTEKLKVMHSAELDDLTKRSKKTIQALESQLDQSKGQEQVLRKRLVDADGHNQTLAQQLKTAQQKSAALEQQIAQEKQKYTEAIAKLRSDNNTLAQSITDKETKHGKELKAQRENHRKELAQQEKSLRAEIAELEQEQQQKLKEARKEIDRLTKSEASLIKKLEKLGNKSAAQKRKLQEKLADIRSQKESLAYQVESLEREAEDMEYERQMGSLIRQGRRDIEMLGRLPYTQNKEPRENGSPVEYQKFDIDIPAPSLPISPKVPLMPVKVAARDGPKIADVSKPKRIKETVILKQSPTKGLGSGIKTERVVQGAIGVTLLSGAAIAATAAAGVFSATLAALLGTVGGGSLLVAAISKASISENQGKAENKQEKQSTVSHLESKVVWTSKHKSKKTALSKAESIIEQRKKEENNSQFKA